MDVEALLDRVIATTGRFIRYLWQQFLLLTWVGKGVAIFVVLFWTGWILSVLGFNVMAGEIGSAAWFVLAVLLTALVIRTIWRNYTGPPRR